MPDGVRAPPGRRCRRCARGCARPRRAAGPAGRATRHGSSVIASAPRRGSGAGSVPIAPWRRARSHQRSRRSRGRRAGGVRDRRRGPREPARSEAQTRVGRKGASAPRARYRRRSAAPRAARAAAPGDPCRAAPQCATASLAPRSGLRMWCGARTRSNMSIRSRGVGAIELAQRLLKQRRDRHDPGLAVAPVVARHALAITVALDIEQRAIKARRVVEHGSGRLAERPAEAHRVAHPLADDRVLEVPRHHRPAPTPVRWSGGRRRRRSRCCAASSGSAHHPRGRQPRGSRRAPAQHRVRALAEQRELLSRAHEQDEHPVLGAGEHERVSRAGAQLDHAPAPRGADLRVVGIEEREPAPVARAPIGPRRADALGGRRTAAVRADHERAVDVVLVAARTAQPHPGRPARRPAASTRLRSRTSAPASRAVSTSARSNAGRGLQSA